MHEDLKIDPAILRFLTKSQEQAQLSGDAKTTMSVMEMGKLLGLRRTDSYWLVNKHFFKTVQISGKIRVDVKSFNRWYDNQVKYHLIGGRPPGSNLKKTSYSAADIGQILGISEKYAYDLIREKELPVITVDYWQRVPKKAFDRWYRSQTHFRNAEDRAKDAALEAATITMPEMARILGIPRNKVYALLRAKKNANVFEIVVIGDAKRITKDSFSRWLESQDQYHLVTSKDTQSGKYTNDNPDYYSVKEASEKYGIPREKLYRWIRNNFFPVCNEGRRTLILKSSFDKWIMKRRSSDGIDR